MGGFGACSCCYCQGCCLGTAPTEWEAEFLFAPGLCDFCEDIVSGVYVLSTSYVGGAGCTAGDCVWGFYHSTITDLCERECIRDPDCGYYGSGGINPPYSDDVLDSITGCLSIECDTSGHYVLTLFLTIAGWFPNIADPGINCLAIDSADEAHMAVTWIFTKRVRVADFPCDAPITLDYDSTICTCLATGHNQPCDMDLPLCAPPSSVTLVPA